MKTGILVTRVLVESGCATGIEFMENNQPQLVYARKEVILSAGVFNSPKILMLSGIGPANELATHGIGVKVDLPGVGQNLHDHLACEVRWKRRDIGNLHQALRLDRAAMAFFRAYVCGSGIASSMPLGAIGLVRSRPDLQLPDAQLLLGIAPLTASPYLQPFVRPYHDAFTVKAMLVKPESRGCVRLRSADPIQAPIIEQRLLTSKHDWQVARSLIRMVRNLADHPALQRHISAEIAPGPAVHSEQALDSYLRHTASTLHHPVGTCRMGSKDDINAVLDSRMILRGIESLRVVDASSMPEIVRGPVNGPVIMMAEKVADYILMDKQ